MDSEGHASCVCDNPMFGGEFCDVYACAGHCLNGGMCFPHWDEAAVEQGLRGSPPPPKLWCVCPKNFTGPRCEVPPVSFQMMANAPMLGDLCSPFATVWELEKIHKVKN